MPRHDTPLEKIHELAREAMGSIDDQHVLVPLLSGSRGERRALVESLIADYENEIIEEAIVLSHNSTDTEWAHVLFENMSAMCCVKGRIKISGPSPLNGQILWYLFGTSTERFAKVFGSVGLILRPYKSDRKGEQNAAA